ncbi:MAG: GNAT family N-acetyltransferase [Acidimicrobiia bacterium]
MTPAPFMVVTARNAGPDDLLELVRMYRDLADEQRVIRAIWPYADGLPAPVDDALLTMMQRSDAIVVVGEIDGIPLGFLVAVEVPLLKPVSDRRIGVVELIFTADEARGVGVGAAMLERAMAELVDRGIDLFDARVSPGHRMAKNFFESNGFKARSITMHRGDSVIEAPSEDRGA